MHATSSISCVRATWKFLFCFDFPNRSNSISPYLCLLMFGFKYKIQRDVSVVVFQLENVSVTF